jgi:hypothetical protein
VTRKVTAAHHRLKSLFTSARAALDGRRSCRPAARALEHLREALDVHFDQEDRLYYPPISALRPEHRQMLLVLGEAHEAFRTLLAAIGAHLERGALADAAESFASFEEAFARHERTEEALLDGLELDVHH